MSLVHSEYGGGAPSADRAEVIFLIGGLLLLTTFLVAELLTRATILPYQLPGILDRSALFLGVLLSIVNFRAWKLILAAMLPFEPKDQLRDKAVLRRKGLSFFAGAMLKLWALGFFIYFALTSSGSELVSLLSGFIAFLLLGSLLVVCAFSASRYLPVSLY